jgi:hypothetical protein
MLERAKRDVEPEPFFPLILAGLTTFFSTLGA